MNSYNTGEWSEFYAFLNLLSMSQFKVDNEIIDGCYIKEVKRKNKIYSRDGDLITTYLNGDVIKIKIDEIRIKSEYLLNILKKKNKRSFEIPEITEWAFLCLGESVCPESKVQKSDIGIKIFLKGKESEYKLSIKSWLGSNPTLINASKNTTRIEYPIKNSENINLTSLSNGKMVSKNTKYLLENNLLDFSNPNYINKELENNLVNFCGKNGPKIFSDLIISYYVLNQLRKERFEISDVKSNFIENVLINKNYLNNYGLLKYSDEEINIFISSLIMVSIGNVITKSINSESFLYSLNVLKNGEINMLLSENNILKCLKNTIKIDTPSTNRHDFGYVKNEGNVFVLNFQIRLTG